MWVTGYLAQQLGIQHLDIMQLWTQERDKLLIHKVDIGNSIYSIKYLNIYVVIHNIICQALQHPDNFLPDYISGPVYGDRALAMALHRRAR